jgi:hypothetical protein
MILTYPTLALLSLACWYVVIRWPWAVLIWLAICVVGIVGLSVFDVCCSLLARRRAERDWPRATGRWN